MRRTGALPGRPQDASTSAINQHYSIDEPHGGLAWKHAAQSARRLPISSLFLPISSFILELPTPPFPELPAPPFPELPAPCCSSCMGSARSRHAKQCQGSRGPPPPRLAYSSSCSAPSPASCRKQRSQWLRPQMRLPQRSRGSSPCPPLPQPRQDCLVRQVARTAASHQGPNTSCMFGGKHRERYQHPTLLP